MGTLLERIERVLAEQRVKNARQWSIDAGLTPVHVSILRRRLKENPNSGVEADTLRALARAANVSVLWLVDGRGEPDATSLIEREDRYPNRAKAATHAREMGLSEEAIRDILAEQYQLEGDRTVLEWFEAMQDRDRYLRRFGYSLPGRTIDDDA